LAQAVKIAVDNTLVVLEYGNLDRHIHVLLYP
jgi:hypothetical protein